MKAREFKEFVKYSKSTMRIKLIDLDDEISCDLGPLSSNGIYFPVGGGYQLTEEELERFWDKEVVEFYIKEDEHCVAYATYPVSYGSPTYTLCLSISNLTEEERKEREKQKEINEKVKELERLSGKTVVLGE